MLHATREVTCREVSSRTDATDSSFCPRARKPADAVIGAIFVILIYASGRPFGIDPVFAMSLAMLVCVPALLGSTAGALLGWLLRRQDDRRI